MSETWNKNVLICMACGILFSVGWWLMVDVIAVYSYPEAKWKYLLPGLLGSAGMLIFLEAPFNGAGYEVKIPKLARLLIVLFSLMISFGAVIWAVFLWITEFLLEPSKAAWPGIAIVLQNVFILTSNLVMKFALLPEDSF